MRLYLVRLIGLALGTFALAGCGISNHLTGTPTSTSQSPRSTTVQPSRRTPTPSASPSSSRTITSSAPISTTHSLIQSPTSQPSSTPSSISKGQRVVDTSTKGFSENATLFPTGWQVSANWQGSHNNIQNAPSIGIANQSTGDFVSYQLGIAYFISGSPIGVLHPSQADRNSNMQLRIVSQHPSSLWKGATTVAIQGDTTQNRQPYNWTLVTYKKVHGIYYFVTGTVDIHEAAYRNGMFQQNYDRLVQGFSITKSSPLWGSGSNGTKTALRTQNGP